MLILDSPGRLVGYIHCRTCRRCVQVDPEMLPPAPVSESYRARLRCSKCSGRGADIQIGWATPSGAPVEPQSGRVVFLNEYTRKPPSPTA